jgi:hypothetical protein
VNKKNIHNYLYNGKNQDKNMVRVRVFNATFNNISVYRGGQFYWWKKPEYLEKTTDHKSLTNFIA